MLFQFVFSLGESRICPMKMHYSLAYSKKCKGFRPTLEGKVMFFNIVLNSCMFACQQGFSMLIGYIGANACTGSHFGLH